MRSLAVSKSVSFVGLEAKYVITLVPQLLRSTWLHGFKLAPRLCYTVTSHYETSKKPIKTDWLSTPTYAVRTWVLFILEVQAFNLFFNLFKKKGVRRLFTCLMKRSRAQHFGFLCPFFALKKSPPMKAWVTNKLTKANIVPVVSSL